MGINADEAISDNDALSEISDDSKEIIDALVWQKILKIAEDYVDEVEQLAREYVCKLFGAEHANVQPHSGAQANMAVYFAMLEVGDMVSAIHYYDGECIKTEGILSRIDKDARILQIVTNKIEFEDLLKIEIIEKTQD